MKITKPDMSNIWAEAGSIAAVDSSKISEGWIVEIPPYEEANFIENRQDEGIAYLMQQGIPEWDSSIEFQAGSSYVQYVGVVYKCLITASGKQPDIYPTYWTKAFDDAGDAQTVQNNLDSITSAANPFTQYLLKTRAIANGIDADLSATNALVSTNLNTVITWGEYYIGTGCTNTPFPNGLMKVWRESANIIYQFVQGSNDQGIATRYYSTITGVWTPWRYPCSGTSFVDVSSIQSQINALQTQLNKQQIQVGDLYLTTIDFLSPTDVSVHLGYGAWARYGEGYALVGRAARSGVPDWTRNINTGFGEYSHAQTVDEMPTHRHAANSTWDKFGAIASASTNMSVSEADNANTGQEYSTGTYAFGWGVATEKNVGSGVPMNIVQPSIVVGVWLRTS